MSSPFQIHPYHKQSFLQRILKQIPDENAVIEFNNLLASRPINNIEIEDLKGIEAKYGLSLSREFKLNLQEFYLVYYNRFLFEGAVSEVDKQKLDHLRTILGISAQEKISICTKLGEELYREKFIEILQRDQNSAQINEILSNLAREFGLTQGTIVSMRKRILMQRVDKIVGHILSINRYSPADDEEFHQLADRAQSRIEFDDKLKNRFNRARQLWELENLALPVLETELVLQKNETCHFQCKDVKWHETRSVKGIQTMKLLYIGAIYLTNKRILFESPGKNVSIKILTVFRIARSSDVIEIQKETGKNPLLQLRVAEEFEIVLKRMMRISRR